MISGCLGKWWAGGKELAEKSLNWSEGDNHFQFVYNEEDPLFNHQDRYQGLWRQGRSPDPAAKRELKQLEELGFLTILSVAKTRNSSQMIKKLGAPKDFVVPLQPAQKFLLVQASLSLL